jgi:3-polyprenyl-4-hydroxybenzoate decarboxylase
MKITCITHRRDPIFRGSLEGTLPGSYSENSVMSSVQRAAIAWNILPLLTPQQLQPKTCG